VCKQETGRPFYFTLLSQAIDYPILEGCDRYDYLTWCRPMDFQRVNCRGRTVRSGRRGRTEDSIKGVALYTIQVSDSGKSGSLWNIPERESFWNLPRCLVRMKGHVVK